MARAQLITEQQIFVVSVKMVDAPHDWEIVLQQEDGTQKTLVRDDILVVTTKVDLGV